jgi:hypothetical protein
VTIANDLLGRVRSNLNEPDSSDALRTNPEILNWLNEGQFDYLHKVPLEHFPELTASSTFSGSQCGLPSDYLFFHSCTVNHTISTTPSVTGVDDCFVLKPGDTYFQIYYLGVLGAWCQVTGKTLSCGPSPIGGTLTYVKMPSTLSTTGTTFTMGMEHEAPIVNFATAMGLLKINDADAETYLKLYADNVQAKQTRGESKEIERA